MHSGTAASVIGGRYRIDGLLGEGGMARVHDAFDERLERRVAVKILRAQTRALAGMRERFQQEARIAARLVHPNIVAVLDYGEDDESSYLVMERLPGLTLRDEIVRGPLSQRRLAQVTCEVLAALAAAHRYGVLHRDIKPTNILLREDGQAKLADFGIAKSFDLRGGADGPPDDLTLTGVVLGTPGYLAPERRSGRPATVQSDLYSVGAVMVEAATGQHAATDGAADPEALIPPFRHVAHRALATDPAARFASADEMRRALRVTPAPPSTPTVPAPVTRPTGAPSRTVPLPAPPAPARVPTSTAFLSGPTPSVPTSRRRHRYARLAALVGVGGIAIAVALFLALSRGDQPNGPAATAASHHAARTTVEHQTTTTTTHDPEVTAIGALATSLRNAGLPGDAALAAALETTALQPAGVARQVAAEQTIELARVLLDGGGIDRSQYEDVVTTLAPTGATADPTPGTPTSPSGSLPGGLGQTGGPLAGSGHGHDHGPGSGDQG